MGLKISSYNVPRGASYFVGQQALVYLTNFAFYLTLARTLTLTEVGQVSLLSAFLALFTTISQIALPLAATRFISTSIAGGDYSTARAVTRATMRLLIILAIVSLTTVALLLSWISVSLSGLSSYVVLLEVSFAGLFLDFATLYGAYFLGLGQYHRTAYQSVAYVLLSRGFGVGLVLLGLGVQGIVIGWVAGGILTLASLIYYWRGVLPDSEVGSFPNRALLSFTIPLFVSSLISLGQGWGDIAILQLAIGRLASTGSYYLTISSANFLSFLWIPLATALYPALSASHKSSGPKALSEKLGGASRLINLTVLPIAASLAAVSPTALEIAFGKTLVPEATTFSILVLTALFTAQGLLLVTTLQALAKTKLLLGITLVATTLDLGFVLVAAASLGTIAGALGRLLLAASTFSLAYIAVHRGVPLKTSNGFLQALVLAIGTSIPLLVADQILMHTYNLAAIQRLPVMIMIFVSSLILMNRKLSIFTRDDFAIAHHVLPRRLRVLTGLVEYLTISGQKPLVRNKLT